MRVQKSLSESDDNERFQSYRASGFWWTISIFLKRWMLKK